MTTTATIPELSLLGGPLHRLGCRLGLVREGTNTVRLGVALGLLAWVGLLSLTLLEGYGSRALSVAFIGVHVRFLVEIPLMFLCETWVVPRMAEFARYIVRSGLVPPDSLPALASDIRRVGRLEKSGLAECICLAIAFALPLIETIAPVPGGTSRWATVLRTVGERIPWAVGWYLGFCLPLFRFLLFRWIWRLGLWSYFLWRLQKIDLNLRPAHSDRTAGLGYLEIVHANFAPLVLAISANFSAQFAEDISSGTMTFEALYGWVPVVLLQVAVLFVGPLSVFCHKLRICRLTGMIDYMVLASRYVNSFDKKWIRDDTGSGESELGTPDIQSLADLTSSIDVVRNMRWIPVGQRQMMELAAAAVLPLLPLFLLKYPVHEMAVRLFQMLTGL